MAIATIAWLAACSASPAAPKGWQAMPGASTAWSSGSGSAAQEYFYSKTNFGGGLQDLASQVTIDALTRGRGTKFGGSVPFAACPGQAGIATFQLANRTTLLEGFAVRENQAIRVSYIRPRSSPVDPNVTQAMQNALCAL